MSYIAKQSKQSVEPAQKLASASTVSAFADQRASTAVQLKQKQLMHSAHSPNVIQQLSAEEGEPLQGEFESEVPAQLYESASAKPNNTGLPDNLKSGIENLSGYSMDDVKVHYNSDKPAQLNAHAYAQGTDIHVAPGQEQHLPHEAWHVVQQKQGRVQAAMQMKAGVPVNDDVGLENEADVMGERALQMVKKDAVNSFGFVDSRPEAVTQRKIQELTKRSPFTGSYKAVYQRQKKTETELKHYAAISEDWGTFLFHAGSGPWDDWELDKIWRKYGPDDSQATMEQSAMDESFEFDHQYSDGQEGAEVFEVIQDENIASGKSISEDYEGSLQTLLEQGVIQAKTYGAQSMNTYVRKGKKYQVTYNRTGKGSINFGTWNSVIPLDGGSWTNPETAHKQKILINIAGIDWIDLITKGKRRYKWKGNEKNRRVHFKAANVKEGVAGDGQPEGGVTWHHQETPRGEMIGVEHEVHKKHGHNGGVALW